MISVKLSVKLMKLIGLTFKVIFHFAFSTTKEYIYTLKHLLK